MKKSYALVLMLSSVSAMAETPNFKSCEYYDEKGWYGTALGMEKMSVDKKVQDLLGDMNECPRQLTLSSLVYTLASTSQYACVYATAAARVGIPQFQCYKR